MAYQVSLEIFEGPLDLLLHLIHKNEVDIFNIPVSRITSQYLEYIQAMQELDMELTSEFLVMAATLLALKAKMLLPGAEQAEDGEAAETEADSDPRRELVEKLLEYQAYKEAAYELKHLEGLRALCYTRLLDTEALRRTFPSENPVQGVNLCDMLEAYRRALKRLEGTRKVVEIPRRQLTVADKLNQVLARLARRPAGLPFRRLLLSGGKSELVVTFLAVLELAHRCEVTLSQEQPLGEIMVKSLARQLREGGKESLGPVLGA